MCVNNKLLVIVVIIIYRTYSTYITIYYYFKKQLEDKTFLLFYDQTYHSLCDFMAIIQYVAVVFKRFENKITFLRYIL